MISSKSYNGKYNFELENEMLTMPMSKKSYVKCQILVGNIERDVIRKISRMKQPYFDKVIEKNQANDFLIFITLKTKINH